MTTQLPTTSVPSIPLRRPVPGQWRVLGAILFVAVVMGAAVAFAYIVQTGYETWRSSLDPAIGTSWPAANAPMVLMTVQLGGQLLELALAWWLAGLWHGDRAAALGFAPVHLTAGQWVKAVALLFGIKIAATIAATWIAPVDPKHEIGPFLEIAKSNDAWLLFLAAVVLAGLTEEILFRGVLSRTLEATRLGFWGGAAIASAAFAVLHMQYGLGGQLVIFAVGMTFAWIRAWSGSLWPAVLCHALNNGLALLAMRTLA